MAFSHAVVPNFDLSRNEMDFSVPITTVYAGTCGLVYVALSFRVINLRMTKNISLGDKQDKTLFYAIRVISPKFQLFALLTAVLF